jgi:hypothetical protein
VDCELRAAELTDLGTLDAPTELPGEQLHPVADPQHRNAELEHLGIELRCAGRVYRLRPAGEDHALRRSPRDLGCADVVREQLRKNAAFADATGDQL